MIAIQKLKTYTFKLTTMKTKLFNNYRLSLIVLLLSTLSILSCKKEIIKDNGSNIELVFTLTGMKEVQTIGSKQASIKDLTPEQKQLENKAFSTTKIGNIELATYAKQENISISFDNTKKSKALGLDIKKKLADNIPMVDGIKYMVLVYNNATGAFVNATLGTAGQAIKIPVAKNGVYKWYAYSYNTIENIPVPTNTVAPTIPTPTNSDLLYDSDIITVGGQADYPISILFEHKLSLIQVELDYDRLFARIEDYDLDFNNTNFLNKGTFNIINGTTTNIEPYTITSLNDYITDDPQGEKIKLAKFYVANPTATATSFDVTINQLSVQYPSANPTTPTELIGPGATQTTVNVSFGSFTPTIGSRFIAKIKLWYNFKTRTILHVTRVGADDYGYAAQPWSSNGTTFPGGIYNRASFNMINEPRNYGLQSNSVVRVGAFTHLRCYLDGTLNAFLTAATKPDITIISVYYLMSATDRTALINYINAGGVVLIMTDGINAADRNAQQPFFRDFFSNQTITLQDNGFNRGSLYAFMNINDEILNGPFGDLRPNSSNEPKYWGEDASPTTTLANIPSDQITYYSQATAANKTGTANGVTMFKHNYKNFFWIGDGGFLSNASQRGIYVPGDYGICPFATDATTNYPIPKNYGEGTLTGWTGTAGHRPAYNSVLFANMMSWAIVNAEFFGINTGGLPTDPDDYVIF